MTRAPFPTPYAGSYYPIYNSGPDQWILPTTSMPFHQVSALFVAFAHAYPDPDNPNGALLTFEQGQRFEPERLPLLTSVARLVNPGIKILISLGWSSEGSDWKAINADAHGANEFPASVVSFIRRHKLDGFDIDDESVSQIDQPTFDRVMQNLRNALDAASAQDGKPYYLTITPAGRTAQVTANNMNNFDLINAQCYGGSSPAARTPTAKATPPRSRRRRGTRDSPASSTDHEGRRAVAGVRRERPTPPAPDTRTRAAVPAVRSRRSRG